MSATPSPTYAPCVDEILAYNPQFETIRVQWDSCAGFAEAFERQKARGDEVDEDDLDLMVSSQAHAVPQDQLIHAITGSLVRAALAHSPRL